MTNEEKLNQMTGFHKINMAEECMFLDVKTKTFTKHVRTKSCSTIILYVAYKAQDEGKEISPCLVTITYLLRNHKKSDIHLFMDSLADAYDLVLEFMERPNFVKYEQVKGRKRKELSEEEFIKPGIKKLTPPKKHSTFKITMMAIFQFIFAPLVELYRRIHFTARNNHRKWEYVGEKTENGYLITKRYCGGRYKRITIEQPWMPIAEQ